MKKSLLVTSMLSIIMAFSPHQKLTVTSSAFRENEMIPKLYTCDGNETSPPLHITGIPAKAKSLAVIVYDLNVKGGFIHWIAWNIDPTEDIPENFKGGTQGYNSSKEMGYKGMCPPNGTHRYEFNVYALDTMLNVSETDNLKDVMGKHILASGKLIGLYKK